LPITVLVVDDAESLRQLLRELIADDARFELVAEAEDAASALELADQHRPDAVILDVLMPERTGLDILPELRQTLPDAAIVLYSALPTPPDHTGGVASSADAYVEKGDVPSELFDIVEYHSHRKRAEAMR
jgi:DNA-binding NarL/FixJ family response regulator